MKRYPVAKSAAVLAALVLTAACAVLPTGAANTSPLVLCTAEAEGDPIPFDITVSSAGTAGSASENADTAGNGGMIDDMLPNTADEPIIDDSIGDPAESPAPDNSADTADKTPTPEKDAAGNPDAGNGNREEGQAGVNEDGMVGEGPADRPGNTVGQNDTNTADNPVENAVDEAADAVDEAANGTGWGSVIVALLIAAALIVVIIALIPRRRTD